MPYPLPAAAIGSGGARVRLLPPLGCPGSEQWVLPMDLPGWLELGYRRGAVPQGDLELFWLPADSRWNEPVGSTAVELLLNPRQHIASPIQVDWGDGSSQVIPWPALSSSAPRLRHLYSQRADVLVRVQLGVLVAELLVALKGCPVPPRRLLNNRDGGANTAGMVQPLIPSAGLSGEAYDGRHAVVWKLRLHPSGGLGLIPDPLSGEPSLAVVQESRVGSRSTRWYAGDGPPPEPPGQLEPPPVAGDFYLDRLSGQLYELSG